MRPVISVIIPTLNEEDYLPRLLEDLKDQTEKNFEVIVVDGHSTDNTKKKASHFITDLNLQFVESPRRNISFQRNYGAMKAKGDYLFFLDADAQMDPDAIEKALIHITNEQYGLYLPVILSSNPAVKYHALVSFVVTSVKLLQKVGKPLSIGPFILIKKELFDLIGGFSSVTTASEDHNLVIKAYKHGVKAKFLSDVRCYFSMRRLERDGIANVIWKYTLFTAETLIKGGVYKPSHYEMGGENYKQAEI